MATATLMNFPGLPEAGPEFHRALIQMAGRLGMNPDYIAGAMYLETGGTYDPAIQNPVSKATGLIQLMPAYFSQFGVTEAELLNMSNVEQLQRIVEPYFASFVKNHGAPVTMADHYLVIFNPAHVGGPSDEVLYSEGQLGYSQNHGLDYDKNGAITVGDIETFVQNRVLARAAGRPPIVVEDVDVPVLTASGSATRGGLGQLLLLGALAAAFYYGARYALKRMP